MTTPDAPQPPSCRTCPYYLGGHCRVNAPVIAPTETHARELAGGALGAFEGVFPVMGPDDGCGMHPDFTDYFNAFQQNKGATNSASANTPMGFSVETKERTT